MTEIKTNEDYFEEYKIRISLAYESSGMGVVRHSDDIVTKERFIQAMQESNEQAVRVALEMAADTLTDFDCTIEGVMTRINRITSLHSQIMDKLKTPIPVQEQG